MSKVKPGDRYYVAPPMSVIVPRAGHKTRVQQSFKDECDVNTVVRNFSKTGQLPPGPPPVFGDARFLAMSLTDRINFIKGARAQFAALPESIRKLAKTPEGLLSLPVEKLTAAIKAEVELQASMSPEARNAAAVAAAVKSAVAPPASPAAPKSDSK